MPGVYYIRRSLPPPRRSLETVIWPSVRRGRRGKAEGTILAGVAVETGPPRGGARDKEERMDKYECTVCGYIYDPDKGDPDGGIEPGTPFEDLPDDWVCPQCGADKDMFEKI